MNVEINNIYGGRLKTSFFMSLITIRFILYNSNYVRDKNTLLSILNNVHFGYTAYGYLVLSCSPRLKSYPSLKQCVQFVLIRHVWLSVAYVLKRISSLSVTLLTQFHLSLCLFLALYRCATRSAKMVQRIWRQVAEVDVWTVEAGSRAT